jgi:hypothetical protein
VEVEGWLKQQGLYDDGSVALAHVRQRQPESTELVRLR